MEIDLKLYMIDKPYRINVMKSHYTNNDSLALISFQEDGEPFATFSTNLGLSGHLPKNQFFFKTWSENEGMLEQLEAAGIVRSLGKSVPSGFCRAELVELVADVEEYLPNG